MPSYAKISGWGSYLPRKILTNTELEALVQTNDEWIRSRTGIIERRIVDVDETTSSMAIKAAEVALKRAGITADQLDLIICATTTPDFQLPATSCLIQRKLGATKAGAFDLNSACTGFLAAYIAGSQFILAGTYSKVLVVASETLSRVVDWTDRNTCVLFGDGASAVVLEASESRAGMLSCAMGSYGDEEGILTIPAGGAAIPTSEDTIHERLHFIKMSGNELFKMAVRRMQQASNECLAKASLSVSDVSMVIPHQANIRIIDALQMALEVPKEKVFVNIASVGNTGAASVGLALDDYLVSGAAKPGDKLLLVSFGGGISWAGAIIEI